ncbi:mycofactocin biosynthesis peptidyl-dipeptidase MftE [Conexibacter sp. CPCC 206217]|uniref:mycofactocin biosynthesis peptidyl-dipeptidase MftE n=1 Tax=Conexibacter sp. CPCC 206217 TaxID=3064574 RepID=UPI0027258531|nr:mycofactocin biosynthesis peptidyl-dipeptidase MftE [Conexibacter sp. CPCC 206217]MDO8210277.1 mycofactocin biosynthesis peptidyl-dipeptidase MftE [Conexibacter sp. CPCC 206217]
MSELTWPDLAERDDALLVVPVGATEQHGPHLPLTTDTEIAVALAQRLAETARRGASGVVVAPAVAYGSSGEHQDFPGTLSIGGEALRLLLIELLRSATRTFSCVLLLNAHGGNVPTLAGVIEHQRDEGRDVRVWHANLHGDAHAGRAETSAMLALAPERVRLDQAAAGATAPLGELIGHLRREGVRAVAPNGVLGDPAGASAQEGQALLDGALDELLGAVREWWPGVAGAGAMRIDAEPATPVVAGAPSAADAPVVAEAPA